MAAILGLGIADAVFSAEYFRAGFLRSRRPSGTPA